MHACWLYPDTKAAMKEGVEAHAGLHNTARQAFIAAMIIHEGSGLPSFHAFHLR